MTIRNRLTSVAAAGLLALSLAGCVTEPSATLPMTLGPSDTAQAACLTYGDTPAYGCKGQDAVSISQDTK